MQASTTTSSRYNSDKVLTCSPRRRLRHAQVRARVATLERKETLHGSLVRDNEDVGMEMDMSRLDDCIKQLEALYQCSPVHRAVTQLSTASEMVKSAGPRHAGPMQLRRARRSSGTSAVSDTSSLNSSRAGMAAPTASSIGGDHLQLLEVIMNLWQMLHEKQHNNSMQSDPYGRATSWWQDDPPRLLTAQEEHALGTVIQQHRKLEQLYQQHPDTAAELPTLGAPHNSSMSHSTADSDISSNSSSSKRRRTANGSSGSKTHGNVAWPPPLTLEDVKEISSWSVAWRAMLPELSEMALRLLVRYNVKLVLHMRKSVGDSELTFEDTMQAGLSGLEKAAQRYDPQRRTRFSTTASLWILAAINRASQKVANIQLPGQYMQIFKYVLRKYGGGVLANIDHRPDVVNQVSAEFNVKPHTILRMLKVTSKATSAGSLDAPSYQGPSGSKGEDSLLPWSAMVTSDDLDADDETDDDNTGLATQASYLAASGQVPAWFQDNNQQQQLMSSDELQLQSWLSVLHPRERRVMVLMYGIQGPQASISDSSNADLDDKKLGSATLADVARQVGVTLERVRQIRLVALKKLQIAAANGLVSSNKPTASSSGSGPGDGPMSSSGGDESTLPAVAFSKQQAAVIESLIKQFHTGKRRYMDLVYGFYKQYGRMPTGTDTAEDKAVGKYCDSLVASYRRGKSQPLVVATVEAIAPGWLAAAAAHQQQQMPRPRRPPTLPTVALSQQQAAVIEDLIMQCRGSILRNMRLVYGFYKEHGRMPTGTDTREDQPVGKYCDNLIAKYRRPSGKIHPQVAAALEAIAPGWLRGAAARQQQQQILRPRKSRSDVQFSDGYVSRNKYLALLQRYVQQYGGLPPRQSVVYQGVKLGSWVYRQRYMQQKLSLRNKQALEAIPGWSWGSNA